MRDEIPWPPAWPRHLDAEFGPPPEGGYRACADDFEVEECLGFAPEGHGEHLWLWIEKRDATTVMVARELARLCEVGSRDIGYAGMKDRLAVTRQWFSVHLPGREAPQGLVEMLAQRGIVALSSQRHPRKLKRGVHRGNRFTLRLSGTAVDDDRFEQRWSRLIQQGVPNYFGPQRFGDGGRNLVRAREVLEKGWRKRDDREGMLLSAARSYLFNAQLGERLARGEWLEPLGGDVMMLDGTQSLFAVETADSAVASRLAEGDIHPTAVLWGLGGSRAGAAAAELEQAVLSRTPALCRGLERAGVKAARRALRVRLTQTHLRREPGQAWVSFVLPSGAFATAVLRELMSHPSLEFRSTIATHDRGVS
ncbi:tRNA pseudouridine(13) synthase TruD [Halomonas sp. V046]|uniref:tRNA pseudouridine(13) synthase TruD n=1 Tax=Halomonas sp. V046 TaxID=3459611 RepID=UPI0040439CB2